MNYKSRPNREDLRVGTLVRAGYGTGDVSHTGIVTLVEERQDLFSEKYAIMETNVIVHVLSEGELKYFDIEEDSIEVISESR